MSCLTASGGALIFSTLLGGSNADAAYGLAMDAGSVYVAGLTASSDFPLKNAFQSLNTSREDQCVRGPAHTLPAGFAAGARPDVPRQWSRERFPLADPDLERFELGAPLMP